MKITVLGSGNGGCAVAFDCAQHGHEVRLFDFKEFPGNVGAIHKQGGITSEGELTGFQPVAYAGHDIQQAVRKADLMFLVGPAYSTRPFAEACRPHLQKGQYVIVCPSSCGGAIEFKKRAGLAMQDTDIIVAETSTLPYAVRVLEPGRIRIYLKLKGGLYLAALPARKTSEVLKRIQDVYPGMTAAINVLHTSLQNSNPVLHPAITALNAALVERTNGNFLFYEEGVTPVVGRLMEAIDNERVQLGAKLGLKILPDPDLGCLQGYMTGATYHKGYTEAPGFKGIRAPATLDHRYFHEDVGYGLVFLQSLGRKIGVVTPAIDCLITLISIMMGRDYAGEAKRTVASLGLAFDSAEALRELV